MGCGTSQPIVASSEKSAPKDVNSANGHVASANGKKPASAPTPPPGARSGLDNIILLTDSYKVSHYAQYPPNTTKIYSYFESRGGKFPNVCWFGLQYFLKRYCVGQVVTREKIDEASYYYDRHFGGRKLFDRSSWEYVLEKHNGRLPVRIKAVPEGTVVAGRNVLMTIENSDPKCFWLTNFLETLLVQVWYPMTICTNSREQKKTILRYLHETGTPDLAPHKLHDFGFRGVSSVETAALGDAAHIVHFEGTDTVPGLVLAREYYGAEVAAFSIPASEHSTMTSWTQSNESAAYENMLKAYPDGIMACVSDSYNIFDATEKIWGTQLKEQVLARDGTLVIRPDSGNPKEVILRLLGILSEKFGSRKNGKGYRVLDDHVRLIQGDGVTGDVIADILQTMKEQEWSADNVGFGSGGGLLQKFNRDTLKCAFKCSFAVVDGKERAVFKNPITDPGKASKQGRLVLLRDAEAAGGWRTKQNAPSEENDVMVEVFLDGELKKDWTFDEVRARARVTEEEAVGKTETATAT